MDAIRTEYPLMIASLNGHVDVVKSLIEAKANINQTTKVGICTLYTVCEHLVFRKHAW